MGIELAGTSCRHCGAVVQTSSALGHPAEIPRAPKAGCAILCMKCGEPSVIDTAGALQPMSIERLGQELPGTATVARILREAYETGQPVVVTILSAREVAKPPMQRPPSPN